MKQLTLSIKQKYFDEILQGTKKNETREIRPNNFKRYCRYLHKGVEYENAEDIPDDGNDVDVVPVKYETIKLLTGEYKGKRPHAVVEVKGAEIYFLKDDDGNEVTYEVDGVEYVAAQVEYALGKVIEKT